MAIEQESVPAKRPKPEDHTAPSLAEVPLGA